MDILTGIAIAERLWRLAKEIKRSTAKKARKHTGDVWRQVTKIVNKHKPSKKETTHEKDTPAD